MPVPKHFSLIVLAAAWLLQSSLAQAQTALASPCGRAVAVERGDTLSRIAERCNVGESAILRANPRVQSSGDLQVGTMLQLRPDGEMAALDLDRAAGRLGDIASSVGNTLGDIAGQVGTTVDDLLAKNPDLQNRLRQFGGRLGVPSADPRAGGVLISPRSGPTGTTVAVAAQGLPENVPVVVGAGQRGTAYEVLQRARTSGDGTVQATVQVPGWASVTAPFVFVVAGVEQGATIRSEPFLVTGPAILPIDPPRP